MTPKQLQLAIERECKRFGLEAMQQAREDLTESYREGNEEQFLTSNLERCSYLAARMPATYGAVSYVFEQVGQRLIHSILDLGAGPGTVLWAAIEKFPELHSMTLWEKDAELAAMGKRLAANGENPLFNSAKWEMTDLEQAQELPSHDMIVLSYSAGELTPSGRERLIANAWKAAGQLLVVIEPGTPVGFDRIRAMRQQIIDLGGHPLAPCPHAGECPIKKGDWCHFSVRVNRSPLHRKMKGGTLGYEDEKFSYFIASKREEKLPDARILRHPLKRSGHVCLTLCTKNGIEQSVVSKRNPVLYKEARKAEWGFPFSKE